MAVSGNKIEVTDKRCSVGGEEMSRWAVPYVTELVNGKPLFEVVADLLCNEGTDTERWHRMIGYWAGCLDDDFNEFDWMFEYDSQRRELVGEDDFLPQGSDYDYD